MNLSFCLAFCSAAFSPSFLLCFYMFRSFILLTHSFHHQKMTDYILSTSSLPHPSSLIFYLWSLYICILLWQINTGHWANVLFWQCLVISRQKKPRDAGCLPSSLKSHPFLLLSAVSLCLAKIEHAGDQAASVRWWTTYHVIEDNASFFFFSELNQLFSEQNVNDRINYYSSSIIDYIISD